MANVPPIPSSYRSARDGLRLAGQTYDKDAPIPAEVIAKTTRINALLSRRWIVPDPDPTHGKTPSGTPQPTHLSQAHRARHLQD